MTQSVPNRIVEKDGSWAVTDNDVHSQEMFCKQKGYLEEELDYRKQALDQAYMVNLTTAFHHTVFV